MDHIIKAINGRKLSFPVYKQHEADKAGIEYITKWKDAQPGDWVMSDDGWIALCTDRKRYTDKTGRSRECLYMVHGTIWLSSTAKFSYIDRKLSKSFTSSTSKTWQEKEVRRERTKNTIRAYVDMFLAYDKIDWKRLGQIYRPDQASPEATVKRLFKEDKISELVAQGIADVLDTQGVTQAKVAIMLTEAYDMAKENEEPGHMIRVAENFAKMLDMFNANTPGIDPNRLLPEGDSDNILDGVFDDIKELTVIPEQIEESKDD